MASSGSDKRLADDEVWEVVKSINEASRNGDIATLRGLTHQDIVVVPPGFQQRARGKDTYLQSVEEFTSQGTVYEYTEHEPAVEIFDNTAIVTYRYESVWGSGEEKFTEHGHDLLVFVHRDGHWALAWRTLIPSLMERDDEKP